MLKFSRKELGTGWIIQVEGDFIAASTTTVLIMWLHIVINKSMIFQAERRFHESSQKLDLLQCSLTRLMGELSPEQAAVGIYKDYITTPPFYADRKSVGLGKQQYTAITKPAALTGELYVSNVIFKVFIAKSRV